MAEPANQLNDQEHDSVYDESGTAPSDPKPQLRALEDGGQKSQPKRGHLREAAGQDTPSRDELSEAEEEPGEGIEEEEPEASFYNQSGQAGRAANRTGRFSLRGYLSRRWAIFGGGMVGTIIALLLMITVSSGHLQFIHIAQLMQRFHFSHQQDASNDRMGRMYRFMRSGGHAGETRIGWLGSKYHGRMIADLEKIGLKPVYAGADIYQGFEIDRSSRDSPFKNMSDREIIATLEERGVNAKAVTFDRKLNKVNVGVKSYINQRRSLKFLSDQAGTSNIPQAIRVRVMARYGLVTWHPLKKIDRKANEKLAALYNQWKADREERLKSGKYSGQLSTAGAQQEDPDPNNSKKTKVTLAPGETGPLAEGHAKELLSGIAGSKSLAVGGAVATGVGLVCTVYSVNEKMGDIRNRQIITPLIRTGMDAVTVGNHMMFGGNDVSETEVSFLAKNFSELDSKGNVVSTWNQSASIQSNLGKTGGIDIDAADAHQPAQPDVKDALRGEVPGWISWANNVPAVNQLCGTAGSIITGAIGFSVTVFSGGLVSAVGQAFAGALIQEKAVDKLSHFLAGESVNVAAAGAQWGNNVDYGSRLAGNAMALQFGAAELSQAQSDELGAIENTKSQAEFNSKNIAYKLFNPYDARSTISKVVDGSSPSFTQNINRTAGMFLNTGKNFGSIFKVFSPKVSAAPKPFDYGFPEYGFSTEDLNNSTVADPYANAEAAATILNSPSGQVYISKAQNCFGVNIQRVADPDNTSHQLWDVIPSDAPANPYDQKYKDYRCADSNDSNWLKIRFFIMDTGVMEGYACYKNDDQSCQNDGFGDSAAPTTSTAGTTADTAQIFSDSQSVACADGTKDLGIQDGYHGGQVVKIRICAVSNILSGSSESTGGYGVSGADGKLVVNSRVSGTVYALAQAAQKDHVVLIANSGFRTMQHQQALFAENPDPVRVARPGYSNHQMGLAIDFFGLQPTPGPETGNPIWDWLSKNAGSFGFKNYPEEAWHWSVTGN